MGPVDRGTISLLLLSLLPGLNGCCEVWSVVIELSTSEFLVLEPQDSDALFLQADLFWDEEEIGSYSLSLVEEAGDGYRIPADSFLRAGPMNDGTELEVEDLSLVLDLTRNAWDEEAEAEFDEIVVLGGAEEVELWADWGMELGWSVDLHACY